MHFTQRKQEDLIIDNEAFDYRLIINVVWSLAKPCHPRTPASQLHVYSGIQCISQIVGNEISMTSW